MARIQDVDLPYLEFAEGAAPAAGASAITRIYAKADGLLYSKDDAGTETLLSSGSSGAVATDAIWDAAGDLAVGTGANTAAKLTIGAAALNLVSNGTTASWAMVPGRLIGLTVYGGEGVGANSWSTTSATQADVDATNAAVTFTAPPSGNVLFRVTALMHQSQASKAGYLGIREGSTDVITNEQVWYNSTEYYSISRTFYVTGVSAGSHTYKLAFSTDTVSTWSILYGNSNGPLTLEVIAAP